MGKLYFYALIAGVSLLVVAHPASARSIADCDKLQTAKAEVLSTTVDPLPDVDKSTNADVCAEKRQAVSQAPAKPTPINIVATGSANILKKAIKGDILPEGEGSLHENLTFKYRIYRPEAPNGDTMVLLHGSGQDETSLVSFGSKIAPNALLLAVRGRVLQDGSNRLVPPTHARQFRPEGHSLRSKGVCRIPEAGDTGIQDRPKSYDLSWLFQWRQPHQCSHDVISGFGETGCAPAIDVSLDRHIGS